MIGVQEEHLMEIRTIGIDLGKTSFHVVGFGGDGRVVLRRRLSRGQLGLFFAKLPPCVVGMEACCGAHHLGRQLEAAGHAVRLIPPQFVRPFVKGQKNDYQDAEAIGEAVVRPTMRFVALKTVDQLDLQALHRVRDRLVGRRTAVINQLRAFLLERGITPRTGRQHLARLLPTLLEDVADQLTPCMRALLASLRLEWQGLERAVNEATDTIEQLAKADAAGRRLVDIPGFGYLTASAMVASIGKGDMFRRGRDLAAWAGLVPRQHSTGGRPTLLGISKRGNNYLRRMLIHGARSVHRLANRSRLPLGPWLDALDRRAPTNVAVVALANKLARIAWAVLTRGEPYRPILPIPVA
jgi:transposase